MPTMKMRWKPSVTVAAIIEKNGKFLLVEEQTSDGLKLNNPAGHLEEGETPEAGCIRETLEESAYHLKPTAFLGVYMSSFVQTRTGEYVTYVRLSFCGEVGEADPNLALDDGIVRTLWLTEDEIRACPERHRSPLLLRCLDDYLAGKRYPLDAVYADSSLALCNQLNADFR